MNSTREERRLAAIVSADVVGYSRLMEADESGTLATMKAHRRELWFPTIKEYGGRLVGSAGDSILVEYSSAVAAVESSIAVQHGMAERGADVPEDRRMLLRIGINIGEVIVDGDTIFGDGVNVAARLQEIAQPGGLAISGKVYDEVSDRLDVAFVDDGAQQVKNIARPVRVWRWALEQDGGAAAVAPTTQVPSTLDKPTIAVLPFENMSGDPEQEFFTDGITKDILTELSRFRDLIVISRTSTFALKGSARNIQEVAKELGAQFIVEGSVRKAGNRVRITVQLIDAEKDSHIWAERYDRDFEDIFAIQDDVTQAIVSTLPGRIEAAARERAERKPPENLAAYEFLLTGKALHHRSTRDDNAEALRVLEKAIELDPKYATAHAWRACTLGQAYSKGYREDLEATIAEIENELSIALSLDDNDSDVHRILAAVKLVYHDFDRATYHQERALSLNPNDDRIVVQQGELLTWLGQAEEGIEWIKKAMRLNPFHPERFWSHLGRACYTAKRYGEAIEAFKRIGHPDHALYASLAACAAQLGDEAEAARHMQQALKLKPDFTIAGYEAALHCKHEADLAHHREGLAKAGLPAE